MAVTLKAIYYCGCEFNEGMWDSRRDMIKVVVEVGIVWMMEIYEKITIYKVIKPSVCAVCAPISRIHGSLRNNEIIIF